MDKELQQFIRGIQGKQRQDDAKLLIKLMEEGSGFKASLNGKIIGFGFYQFKYKNGKDGVRIATGFSPRKQNFTLYIMNGFSTFKPELQKLGKHKISSKCCLYINKLADIDESVLKKIIQKSISEISKRHNIKGAV